MCSLGLVCQFREALAIRPESKDHVVPALSEEEATMYKELVQVHSMMITILKWTHSVVWWRNSLVGGGFFFFYPIHG